MFQTIGAYLDVVLFVVVGLFCLLSPSSIVSQDRGPEEIKKRLKILRISGAVTLISGIGLLSLKIAS